MVAPVLAVRQRRNPRSRVVNYVCARRGRRLFGVERRDGLVARVEDGEDLVEAGDLERLGDVLSGVGDREPAVAGAQALDRADEDAEGGGVEERRLETGQPRCAACRPRSRR